MTIEQLTRVCSYPWYGAGGHQSLGRKFEPPLPPFAIQGHDLVNADGKWVSTIRATHRFNLRLFVDAWSIVPEKENTNQNFTIKLNPTEQNFYNDDFLRLLHANGRNAIFCPSGLFDWLKVDGFSQRKSAFYDHSRFPSDPAAWKDAAHLFKLLAEYFKDKPYEVILQGGNELDFRWNVEKELTPEEIAVGQWEIIKAIQSVNQKQKIMLGCTLNPTMDTFNRYVGAIEQLAAAEGKTVPYSQLIWSDNHYVRDQGGNQGGGLADTPESQWEQTYVYRTQLNEACKKRGMKFEITEHGYSNSTSTSFAALKQKAPTLQGVSHDEAQGVLWFRSMLMYASFSECTGVSVYHVKDGFETEPFTYIGINYDKDFGGMEDWSSKPAKIYYESQLDLYGTLDVVKYQRANNIYYATLSNGQVLHWTDKVNIGNVTPVPALTTNIPPPPMRHPKKQGSTLVWSDTGERIIIRELGSPEALLAKPLEEFKAIIDYAVSVGLNCGYFTLYAGDKYSATLHPYNGTKEVTIPNGTKKQMGNPSSGFNMPKILDIKTKLEYAASKGMLLHLITSEKENHHVRTAPEERAFIDMMVEQLDNLPIIWGKEEVPTGMDGYIIDSYTYLQSKTQNITAIHNNTGEKPWIGHADIIDLLSIQADANSFDGIIRAQTAAGFAVYASECTGTHAPGDTAKAAKLRDAGGTLSSGAGIYIAPLDQDATLAQLKQYEPVFKTLSGTTTPNPNPMRNAYLTALTTVNNDAAVKLIEGTNVGVGKYAIYVDGANGVELELFKDDVSFIAKRREGVPPLAVGGDDNGKLRLVDFPAGKYRLVIIGQEDISFINFTVGSVTPPPTEVKGTTFVKTIEGKVKFNFEDGIPIIL